jgi:hypothetical protein
MTNPSPLDICGLKQDPERQLANPRISRARDASERAGINRAARVVEVYVV